MHESANVPECLAGTGILSPVASATDQGALSNIYILHRAGIIYFKPNNEC